MDDPEAQRARIPLSQHECEILTLSARGLNVNDVSRTLKLPDAEVRSALMAARGKLGASSKLEAVIVALREGYIRSET